MLSPAASVGRSTDPTPAQPAAKAAGGGFAAALRDAEAPKPGSAPSPGSHPAGTGKPRDQVAEDDATGSEAEPAGAEPCDGKRGTAKAAGANAAKVMAAGAVQEGQAAEASPTIEDEAATATVTQVAVDGAKPAAAAPDSPHDHEPAREVAPEDPAVTDAGTAMFLALPATVPGAAQQAGEGQAGVRQAGVGLGQDAAGQARPPRVEAPQPLAQAAETAEPTAAVADAPSNAAPAQDATAPAADAPLPAVAMNAQDVPGGSLPAPGAPPQHAAAPPPLPVEAPAPAVRGYTPAVPAQQVAPIILAQAAKGGDPSRLIVQLRPAELGGVEVAVEGTRDGGTQVNIMVERPETLALLQRDRGAIEQALQAAGIDSNAETLTLSLGEPGQGGGGGDAERGRHAPREGTPNRWGLPGGATTETVSIALPRRVARGLLDLAL